MMDIKPLDLWKPYQGELIENPGEHEWLVRRGKEHDTLFATREDAQERADALNLATIQDLYQKTQPVPFGFDADAAGAAKLRQSLDGLLARVSELLVAHGERIKDPDAEGYDDDQHAYLAAGLDQLLKHLKETRDRYKKGDIHVTAEFFDLYVFG